MSIDGPIDVSNSNSTLIPLSPDDNIALPEGINPEEIQYLYKVEELGSVDYAVMTLSGMTPATYKLTLFNNNLEVAAYCTCNVWNQDTAYRAFSADDLDRMMEIKDIDGDEDFSIVDVSVVANLEGQNLGAQSMYIAIAVLTRNVLNDPSSKNIGYIYEQNPGYASHIASKLGRDITWIDQNNTKFIFNL